MPLQILLSEVFPKEQSKWFVILVAGLRIISSRPRHSEQVCSIVLGLLFSFPDKFAQASTWSCCRDAYALYFIDLLCLWDCWLWLAVFTVLSSGKDGRYGFKISRKHWRYVATGLKPRTTYFVNEHSAISASLAKWLSVCLRTKWFWVRIQLQSLKRQILRLLRARTWHSGNCRVRIHSETHTWHDKDIQSKIGVCFVC